MNLYVEDEVLKIKSILKRIVSKHKQSDEYIVFVDESPIAQYFAYEIAQLAQNIEFVNAHIVALNENVKQSLKINFNTEKYVVDYKEFIKGDNSQYKNERRFFCLILDTVESNINTKEKREVYLENLEKILEHATNTLNSKLVLFERIPALKELPKYAIKLSEREYKLYASEFENDSLEKFVIDAEEMVRSAMKNGLKAVIARTQNVFGPGIYNEKIAAHCKKMINEKVIETDSSLYNSYIGMTSIRYVIVNIFQMFAKGIGGNTYNLEQYITTDFRLALNIYEKFANTGVGLDCTSSQSVEAAYALLDTGKVAKKVNKNEMDVFKEAVYKSAICLTDDEYVDSSIVWKYDGKLDLIKKIEMDMMLEIKRICEKHNIKYFLVGGSMLGAIRHKGFIPWDDDLDIGMLRDDYEKFQEVAPKELNEKYFYQSYRTEESHYIFDKIRLKDTYFTTKFSKRFKMENGLFIDILVYDKTSKSKFFQKLQIKAITVWSRVINVRWVNVPRKRIWYNLTKKVLPIMRLFPFDFYHKVFEIILQWYRRTNSEWLIDGVGQNVRKGAFPSKWFDEIIEVPFENTMLPVPKYYDEYLRHWYGEHYMELLPPSLRDSGHVLGRIDLGAYLGGFSDENNNFHCLDKSGELYEKNKKDFQEMEE